MDDTEDKEKRDIIWYFVWEMSEIVVFGEEPGRNGLVNKPVEENLSKHKEIQCIQIKRGYYFPRNIKKILHLTTFGSTFKW